MKKIMILAILIPVAIAAYFFLYSAPKPVSTGELCVSIGEPLFPTSTVLPLNQFVSDMQKIYEVNVNYTTNTVMLHNPKGGIGSLAISTFYVHIMPCKT